MNRGVIVLGYQGIGKSTLSDKNLNFIDLESGNFWIENERHEDWYIPYCNIANHLASQGYVVFVSTHKVVRDYLKSIPVLPGVSIVACVPALNLKPYWIEKLKMRFEKSGLDKDFKAWKNAEDRYEENIQEIADDFPVVCEISDMQYDLERILQVTFTEHNILYYSARSYLS